MRNLYLFVLFYILYCLGANSISISFIAECSREGEISLCCANEDALTSMNADSERPSASDHQLTRRHFNLSKNKMWLRSILSCGAMYDREEVNFDKTKIFQSCMWCATIFSLCIQRWRKNVKFINRFVDITWTVTNSFF